MGGGGGDAGASFDVNVNGGCATDLCCGNASDQSGANFVEVCNAAGSTAYTHTWRGQEVTWPFACKGAIHLVASGVAAGAAYMLI